MSNMEQIKECPYCKGVEQTYIDAYKSVQCACGAFGPTADNETEAVELWNAAANQMEALRNERDEANHRIENLILSRDQLNDYKDIWYKRAMESLDQRDEARAWARKLYHDNQLKDGDITRLCEELDAVKLP